MDNYVIQIGSQLKLTPLMSQPKLHNLQINTTFCLFVYISDTARQITNPVIDYPRWDGNRPSVHIGLQIDFLWAPPYEESWTHHSHPPSIPAKWLVLSPSNLLILSWKWKGCKSTFALRSGPDKEEINTGSPAKVTDWTPPAKSRC